MDNKTKNKKYLELEKLKYDDNSQNVKLIDNTPIIARKIVKVLIYSIMKCLLLKKNTI